MDRWPLPGNETVTMACRQGGIEPSHDGFSLAGYFYFNQQSQSRVADPVLTPESGLHAKRRWGARGP